MTDAKPKRKRKRPLSQRERTRLSYEAKIRYTAHVRDETIEILRHEIAKLDAIIRDLEEKPAYLRRQRMDLIREYRHYGGDMPIRKLASMDMDQIRMATRDCAKRNLG